MQLQIKYVRDIEHIGYQTEGDAALDLRASGTWVVDLDHTQHEFNRDSYPVEPGERVLIKTGVAIAIPTGHFGSIRDRSGLAMKHGLHVLGGVIDENYRGEIGVVLVNMGTRVVKLNKNDRIAQLIIQPYAKTAPLTVEEFTSTARGEKGFGSSGMQ